MLEAGGMKLPFKVMDRTFVALIATGPSIFIVPSTSTIKNLKDLEAEIKRDPGNFKWSSFGTGSTPDFVMRTFLKEIGVDVLKTKPVMCRGGSEAATLVSGGHILLGTASPATFIAVTKAGTVRAIAVTGKKRLPDYPNADPAEEQGYPSVSQHMWWMGITGPPNLPSFVVDAWTNALGKVVKNQEFISKLEDLGYALFFVTSLEAKKHVGNEILALKKAWE
jgi:tripartite-type tricarboxylate transporter receptor subunit TctC